ncbi:MAG: glycosyltransferase family 1 protein [Chloroflexi bacterium]|nr:MAG: glycosyltransferase family 1 protein [Chloroflexota bacterium]
MRILCFNWRDITHPMAGGAELYLHEIARRLATEHEVVLFCGSYKGCQPTDEIDGIRIRRCGGAFFVYVRAMLDYLLRSRKSCDIVIDSINGVPFFTPLFSRKPKVAIIHHLARSEVFFKELPLPLAIVGWLAERSIPLVYRRTPVVTVSPSSLQELAQFGVNGHRVHTVYNAVDHAVLGCGTKSPTPLVAYVGRIKKYKQVEHLIRAFGAVKRAVPEAELLIAGRGDYTDLQKEVEGSPAKSSVTLRGEVSEREKAEILKAAWVFVVPSAKEGWGISVIEANACGTPAIAYDVPGLRDSIQHGETGLLVPSGDLDALAKSIVLVLTEAQLRGTMSANAVEWSSKFNWDKSAEDFRAVLEKVANGRVCRSV